MNRQQRRAAQRQQKRSPAPKPNDAQGHNALACALLQQGKLHEAAEQFACALVLMPELFDQYPAVVATLLNVNPSIRAGVECVARAWPAEPAGASSGRRPAPIASDPLLRCMLRSATVRDLALERYLTSLRRIILNMAVVHASVSDRAFTRSVAARGKCLSWGVAFAASRRWRPLVVWTGGAARRWSAVRRSSSRCAACFPLGAAGIGAAAQTRLARCCAGPRATGHRARAGCACATRFWLTLSGEVSLAVKEAV
jgi:hypothetical protein